MKKFVVVLSGLLVMPAFAEVAPVNYYDEAIEYSDELPNDDIVVNDIKEDVQPVIPVVPATVSPRANISRSASRALPSVESNVSSRSNSGRSVSSRTTNTLRSRENTNMVSSRSLDQNVTSRRNSVSNKPVARAATLTQTDTVSTPLYYSTSRVSVRPTGTTASLRAPTVRAATTASSADATVSTGPTLDELAQMTDFCKAQYTQCMDNFCNVLDDNQGRCSCSANIKNYAKTEDGLKSATEELQDVAQKIQYIGLTKDEIETLFSQTEAETEMQNKTDTTQLKNDLDKVKSLIFDVKSGTSVASDTGLSLDLSGLMDFSFDNTGFDLNTLFNGSASANSISNQRGGELYKTATARCKTAVLDSCKAQGVDTTVVSNSYDLEIDKQCIVYERSLSDANTQMISTVRNAKSVLQKARLVVAQQKNSYDLRGCINALDSCMQDDFVCGSDYENCLDPTGKYIVNGGVVVGSEPGVSGGDLTSTSTTATGLYSVWNYTGSTTWGAGTIDAFINQYIGTAAATPISMVDYLEQKIGYNDPTDGKNYGMCISVLNKCQDQTYDKSTGDYERNNDVVKGYLERTLIQIKVAQDDLISNYAENCLTDVASCLSTNNYTLSASTAVNACSSVIKTCASVTGSSTSSVVNSATTSSSASSFPIIYNFNGYASSWASGYSPTLFYNKDVLYTLPVSSNVAMYPGCIFSGWAESSSSPLVTTIPVGTIGVKTYYLQGTGCIPAR
ncbi:MAG: hypothetical protein JW974_01575 [Alphaproteobacteria bacterium]|nr:hypothetical protein [Alphaproteobacteria bacterium]MBN2675471.1 hypothetical protein [Alphaproteobacteria bacterium]